MSYAKKWYYLFWAFIFIFVLYLLRSVLTPFIIAVLLAYFFNPIVDFLERHRVPRVLGVIVTIIFMLFIIFCFVFLLVPLLQVQLVIFIHFVPKIINWIILTLWPWLDKYLHLKEHFSIENIQTSLLQHIGQGSTFVMQLSNFVLHSGQTIAHIVLNIILVPVLCFYLMKDWYKITEESKTLLPRQSAETIVQLVRQCGDAIAGFLRGQLLVMLSLGVIYGAGLWFVGLDVGLLIGFITGLFSIVPYLGFVTGFIISLIAAAVQFHTLSAMALVCCVFAVGGACESTVLTPNLVGHRVGLHPLAVIFAILCGGTLFGIFGVLLAVPTTAVVVVVLGYFKKQYLTSNYYLEGSSHEAAIAQLDDKR